MNNNTTEGGNSSKNRAAGSVSCVSGQQSSSIQQSAHQFELQDVRLTEQL